MGEASSHPSNALRDQLPHGGNLDNLGAWEERYVKLGQTKWL